MIFNGINTIYNIKLQNAKAINVPYSTLINTTLNEKFGIDIEESTGTLDVYPNINLLTIGTDPNFSTNTDLNRLNLTRSKHSPLDAALFSHMPFYLREVNDVDKFPPSERIRLKKTITINNVQYLVGYGYELNGIDYKNDILIYNNIKNEYVNVSKLDTNDATLLNPTPRNNLNLDFNNINNSYVTDFLKVEVYFTESELINIKYAMEILYGKVSPITEIGICNSIYKVVDNKPKNTAVQIAYFLDADINIEEALVNKFLNFYIDLGGMDILTI